MGAQEKLAEAIHRGSGCSCGIVATPTSHTQVVIDAIREMSPGEQAELLGGEIRYENKGWRHDGAPGCRVVGPWREDA